MIRAFAATLTLAALSGPAPAQHIVPYDPEYAPLSYQTDAGDAAGFDVAVARALAKTMAIDIAFRAEFFSVIKAGFWPDDWLFTVSSLSANADRAERFDFVGLYYFDAVVVVTHAHSPAQTQADLAGSRIAICSGCIYDTFVTGSYDTMDGEIERPFGDAAIVTYPSETDMLRALSDPTQDRIDMAITSIHKADFFIATNHSLRIVGPPLFVEPVWIAVPKARSDALPDVTQAFEDIRDDGTLAALSRAHLGADYTALVP